VAINIGIPKLGMLMTQATLVEWKAKEGEQVEKDAIVLVIEADKTGFDIPAESSGFLHILVEEGSEVPVFRVVGMIAETKEELETLQKEPPREIFTTVTGAKEPPQGEERKSVVGATAVAPATEGERIRISPLARSMAQEHMIDLSKITGTGPEGRITKDDIERAIEEKKTEAPEASTEAEVYFGKKVKSTMPLKGMRKAIAEHMLRSLSVSAQVTTITDLDVTDLVRLRERLLRQEKTIGTRITYTDILVLILAKVLKDNSLINSSLLEGQIRIWEDINIGVAVGVGEKGDKGLIVPVIKNADQKSLLELSKMIKSFAHKAQTGKLMPDDVTGGTFTLSSLGGKGIGIYQTPIINQPEAAILGLGRIRDCAVVKDGKIAIAPMMPCSITVDHRIIDGVIVENFLGRLQEFIENTDLLLL
jgi:pyruvate dehydrogenase E2 component (dihydrolipoamide acetyltransferase)